jgi:single-stranded DNA-binding protein
MTIGIEVALIGRLGGAPEFKLVRGGTMPLLSFSVVVNDSADRDAPGQWLRCAAFNDRAEALNGTLAKGDKVYLEGRLKIPVETYQPREGGEARASLEVLVNVAHLLGKIGRLRPRADPQGGEHFQRATAAKASLDDEGAF